MNASLQTYAAMYQAAGFIPLPILSNSKHPACKGWQTGTTPEAFAMHGGNIGLTFGAGLFVLDVDVKNGANGMDTLEGLEAKYGELPATLTAETPSGGRHIVFRKPEGVKLGNRVGIMPGLDVRAAGGFIVAEPSTLDGKNWHWNDWQPDTGELPEIADAPQWLLTAISKPAPEAAERATSATGGTADAYTTRALERATSAVLSAAEGARNDELNAAAYGLARLAAAGRLDWGQCEHVLTRAARAAGLEDGEIVATLASAYAAGMASPNHEGEPDTGEEAEPLLLPVSVGDVLTNPSKPPRFVWGHYLPRGVVALLGAHGGTGKSTIALMLAVAVATGQELFGIETERCRVLFASFEDDGAIVRHRLETICKQWFIEPAELEGHLVIVDGTESPELFTTTARDAGSVTPTYTRLEAMAEGAGLVIVDNASDTFGGDEINRRQVRAFMRSLGRIAKANDAAVLLLAHVDKNTSRAGKAANGEGYSGSTAWHNSARSRLFMVRDESGELKLSHQKTNFGKVHPLLSLDWPEDGLPQLSHAQPGPVAADSGLLAELDTRALLALIAEFSERGEHVTTATTSRTHAAKLLASEPTYPKSRKPADVFTLLREAERAEYIERITYQGADRKPRERWNVTSKGREFAGLAATAATAATVQVTALSAQAADSCGDCGDFSAGVIGGKESAQVGAKVSAAPEQSEGKQG
ncbi:MAG: AAA family ATPase [Thermomonas sp.]|uniref:AAA family ATPase n=1 Tax=Thermomonas sp. TaxID=1971895 RepID=UPI001EB16AE2|nr:AAA family ATPase [Thermomonas sp.]MBV2208201.1 AAA family ATPase [Thermomonas sp.]